MFPLGSSLLSQRDKGLFFWESVIAAVVVVILHGLQLLLLVWIPPSLSFQGFFVHLCSCFLRGGGCSITRSFDSDKDVCTGSVQLVQYPYIKAIQTLFE
ncbi:hypothetical protein A2U01_0041569, partial [Trifolium medium]|nr:hypothetical protein [Trifolium medium]